MSSFARRMVRKVLRKKADYVGPTQPFRVTDRGYETLRPTKGWLRMSYARMAAQQRVGLALDHVPAIFGRAVLAPRSDDPTYRKGIWPAGKQATPGRMG